jgi:hypothetical protein
MSGLKDTYTAWGKNLSKAALWLESYQQRKTNKQTINVAMSLYEHLSY